MRTTGLNYSFTEFSRIGNFELKNELKFATFHLEIALCNILPNNPENESGLVVALSEVLKIGRSGSSFKCGIHITQCNGLPTKAFEDAMQHLFLPVVREQRERIQGNASRYIGVLRTIFVP